MKKKPGLYELSVIAFFYLCPLLSVLIETLALHRPAADAYIRWVIFWGVGMRLFTCGLWQAARPRFTGGIFGADERAYPIVRELGFANICTGVCGLLSLFVPVLRPAALLIGFLYYLLALAMHLFRKEKNESEGFATLTDLTIVIELAVAGILMIL